LGRRGGGEGGGRGGGVVRGRLGGGRRVSCSVCCVGVGGIDEQGGRKASKEMGKSRLVANDCAE